MGTKGHILLHLAAALAGWGIARPLLPPAPDATEAIAPGKASAREARDREAGEKLLRRLVPDLAPAPPAEIVRHEGTLEERVKKVIEENPSASDAAALFPVDYVRCLQEEIDDTMHGVNGPELSYAFLNGRMEASQVLDTLGRIFPDLARENQFPKAVFLELLPVDPVRAVVLLDGLSPEERSSWLADSSLHITGIDRPDLALAILNLDFAIAAGTNASYLRNNADFSSRHFFHDSMGHDYIDWILAQPPSKGRELMLGHLVSHLEGEDPAAAVSLKKRFSTR